MPGQRSLPEFKGKELEYYNALMKVRNQLSGQIQGGIDSLDCTNDEKRGVTTHMADVSSDNVRNEMKIRMLSEDGDVLHLIDEALERLANGEFGKCQECGEMIPEGRLKIRPYAVFCTKCKSKIEEMMRQ